MPKPVRRITDPNLIAWAIMIRALAQTRKGLTTGQLVQLTGLSEFTVERYCAALHARKAAYISEFEMDPRGAYTVRLWKLGDDDDAIPPARPRGLRARAQRHREMMKGNRNERKQNSNVLG